jgi:hypothetical protein
MKSHRVRMFLNSAERKEMLWPAHAERFVNEAVDSEIARRGTTPHKFIARKGDLLIWHGRLMHRGSIANVPGMKRRTLVSHYSALSHRFDMPRRTFVENGSAYFFHDVPLDFNPYLVTETSSRQPCAEPRCRSRTAADRRARARRWSPPCRRISCASASDPRCR